MSIKEYIQLDDNWDEQIKNCCEQALSADPVGSDCCYDDWKKKLRFVLSKYESVNEHARIKEERLILLTSRRDKLKLWFDELTTADELTHKICTRLGQLFHHIHDISDASEFTEDSINILFCMIKDRFTQIDKIKTKYDYIINYINCLDDPVFETGKGLLKCLDDYYQKLDAVIKTRDSLITLILYSITLSNQINQNLGQDYGIANAILYWKKMFKCREEHEDSEQVGSTLGGRNQKEHMHNDNICIIQPKISMPICKDEYYINLKKSYENYTEDIKTLSDELTELNRKKEKLLACKKSLEDAIKEVDPKNRCK